METGESSGQGLGGGGGGSDPEDSSFLDTSSSTTTTAASTRRYSVAGVIRSIFHAVLVQDTEHLDHVLSSLSLDPNKVRDKEGKTMLMVAATENKHRVLRYLLTQPTIIVDLQDDEGETALYQAAAAGSTECVQLLLLAGASASRGNEESITPLIIASYNGFVSICRLLITVGHANVNQQDNTQKSALLLASYAGHVDVMAELIEQGASLNILDQYGWSSLMLAAYAGKLDACKLLLSHGADPHIRTANGKNARSLSWDAGHKSIAVYISKFLARGNNASSSSSGPGSSMSSRTMIQQMLPPAPRSPSRRTHSPAPSLPSVPEEVHDEGRQGTQRSFSAQNSTTSRQSALSSRLTSRRPHPVFIAPLSPRAGEEEPVSPIPTAIASSHLVNLFNIPDEAAFAQAGLEEAPVASASTTLARPGSAPAVLPVEVPVISAPETDKTKHEARRQPPMSTTQTYQVRRHGIIPRYGSRNLRFYSEGRPEDAVPALAPSETPVPERFQLQMRPSNSVSGRVKEKDLEKDFNNRVLRRRRYSNPGRNRSWVFLSSFVTICCPARILPRTWNEDRRRDWREKFTIGTLITGLSLIFGFLAFGLPLLACRPHSTQSISPSYFNTRYGNKSQAFDSGGAMVIRGIVYDVGAFFSQGRHPSTAGSNITNQGLLDSFLDAHYGTDVSFLFPASADLASTCQLFGAATSFGKCSAAGSASISYCHQTQTIQKLLQSIVRKDLRIVYTWTDIQGMNAQGHNLFVYDGAVFDVTDYLNQEAAASSLMTSAEISRIDWIRSLVGKDATLMVQRQSDHKELAECFQGFFQVGVLSGQTNGCLASIVINMLTLAILLLITTLRVASALVYQWIFIRPRLSDTGKNSSNLASVVGAKGQSHVLMLVTCRANDSEDQIRVTLDSLALTEHGDNQKLLLVITDATTDGAGALSEASLSCLRLMNSSTLGESQSEKAVFATEAQDQDLGPLAIGGVEPIATEPVVAATRVYSGHYVVDSRRVPYILVIRPSRRYPSQPTYAAWQNKRLIVRWLHRVCFDEPMSSLEFALFEKVGELNRFGPGQFEMLLTAEVGIMCGRLSVSRMVDVLESNERIMGVSGHGQILNGNQNWLTRIQDYEHHLSLQFTSAFESMVGAVQCLPSRLSLIRIKIKRSGGFDGLHSKIATRRSGDASIVSDTDDAEENGDGHAGNEELEDDEDREADDDSSVKMARKRRPTDVGQVHYSVPILIHPNVVSEFVDHSTRTLYERSMVLNSGEDRYLTGLLHKTFPSRRVVYLPHAIFQFSVTGDFRTYMEEQRLLLVSSFHNLWTQIWSRDSRGAFCCSINFLALLEWLNLVLLPAVTLMTLAVIAIVIVGAVTNAGALYSLPTVLALAFMLSATVLQPILGILLGRGALLTDLIGFSLFMIALPFKSWFIPLHSCWHRHDTYSPLADDRNEKSSYEPSPLAIESATTARARPAGPRTLRHWAEWHSMRLRRKIETRAAQDPIPEPEMVSEQGQAQEIGHEEQQPHDAS